MRLFSALWLLANATACFLTGPRARPPAFVDAAPTPERIARGRYLGEHVLACLYCHSTHDWSKYTGPIVPGTEGGGGVCLGPAHDVNGDVCTQNLTPHRDGLGLWSDAEIARAVREGIGRDGRALFPSMPWAYYRALSDDDVGALIAWLHTLKPLAGRPRPVKLAFPTNVLINTLPEPLEGPVPPPADPGAYLVRIAGCDFCHTRQPRGQRDVGRDFAGGFELLGPWGRVTTPNITPHPTGLGRYTRDEFISRVKSWEDFDEQSAPARPQGATVMPWKHYSGMTEHDLGLVYDWLMTQKPIDNAVTPFQ